MSPSNRLILNLAPDRLSVALVKRGRVVRAESIDLDCGAWAERWDQGLMSLDQPLRQLVSRFPARPGRRAVTLLYHSPTLSKQVYTFELGAAEARDAAASKLRESVGYTDPVETVDLSRPGREAQQSTVLAVSEREELLRALYAWLNRCGVDVEAMIPVGAAVIKTAAEIAAEVKPGTAVLYIDADAIVMVYASDGRLALVRPADMGYRKFTEAYAQAFRATDGRKDEEAEDKDAARHLQTAGEMLYEHGIPLESKEVDGMDLRSGVFPFMAPVLQRICIDIKQTLRFGLAGSVQPERLLLCGPGAGIPNVGKAIGQNVELHIGNEPGTENFEPGIPFGRGTLERYIAEARSVSVSLLPEIAHAAEARRGLNRALLTGAALAMVGLGLEFGLTTLEQERLRAQMSADAPRIATVDAFHERCERMAAVSAAAGDVTELLDTAVGSGRPWRRILAQLGGLGDQAVRIGEIRGDVRAEASYIDISGIAVSDSELGGGERLEAFVAEVEKLEDVASVSLGATSRIEVEGGKWGNRFSMKIELAPARSPYSSFAAATEAIRGEAP